MTPTVPDDYEAQYDCETLQRAADIMKNPSRMAKAKSYAEEKAAKLRAIAGEHAGEGAEHSLMKGYRSI